MSRSKGRLSVGAKWGKIVLNYDSKACLTNNNLVTRFEKSMDEHIGKLLPLPNDVCGDVPFVDRKDEVYDRSTIHTTLTSQHPLLASFPPILGEQK